MAHSPWFIAGGSLLELQVRGCADVERFMAHSPWFIAGGSLL